MFTDDSECLENNYCTKTIDARTIDVPCLKCKELRDCDTEYGCMKQPTKFWLKELVNYLYKSCPLPTEPIRCASCGTVLGQTSPTLESRVEKLEETKGDTCPANELGCDKGWECSKKGNKVYFKNWKVSVNDEINLLQSENARLKELHKNAVEFNIKKLAEINQLQSELESLKKNQLSKKEINVLKDWFEEYKKINGWIFEEDSPSIILVKKLQSMAGVL